MSKIKLSSTEKRDNAIQLSRDILESGNCILLDTETTGMSKADVVIELAILEINPERVAADLFLKHSQPINYHAQKVHGITKSATDKHGMVYNDVHDELVDGLECMNILAYNASFDCRLLTQTALASGINFDFGGLVWTDVMPLTSDYHGKKIKLQDFCAEYQIQRQGRHRALADCYDTLAVVKFLASQFTSYEVRELEADGVVQ